MADIIYNNIKSSDFGLELINDLTHEFSTNSVDQIPIDGRDGVLLIDNQRLNPVEKVFPMTIRKNINLQSVEISNWLSAKGWNDLELSWDPNYLYQATVTNMINIQEVLEQFGKIRLIFLVHPVKILKDSLTSIPIIKGDVISNRGNVPAKPLITLEGNGNTVLTINGRRTPLEDIQGSITLDMNKNLVYSGNLSAWDKVLYESDSHKPYLDIGDNTIHWSGDFAVTIKTYEGVKL